MCGSATLAMEVSRTSINAANATVAAISHGFAFGFHCSLLSTSTAMPVLFCCYRCVWMSTLISSPLVTAKVQEYCILEMMPVGNFFSERTSSVGRSMPEFLDRDHAKHDEDRQYNGLRGDER